MRYVHLVFSESTVNTRIVLLRTDLMEGEKGVTTLRLFRTLIRRNIVSVAVPTFVGFMIYWDCNRTRRYKAEKLAEKEQKIL